MNICFTDKAISDVRHSKLEFIFKPFIDIPFKNIKHTRLKGLKLRVFRNGEIYFVLQYWFEGKPKKITLGEYIPGVLKPEKGDVKVDKKSIFTNLRGWQNLIGYVPQKIFILDDSLRNNIVFGYDKNKVDDKTLLEIIQKINLSQLLDRLPKGLDNKLGEKGLNISAGEVQRIGIARALIYKPTILFLDEATSSLDISTEKQILSELDQFSDKTFISVAHRINTLKNCDNIYNIDNGTIIDSGSFEKFSQIR